MPRYKVVMLVRMVMEFKVDAESENAAKELAEETYIEHMGYGVVEDETEIRSVVEVDEVDDRD